MLRFLLGVAAISATTGIASAATPTVHRHPQHPQQAARPVSTKPATASVAPSAAPEPSPIGSPASWFPADSYPPAAKAAGAEGRTEFALGIDAKGRITTCNITKTSGSPLLDSTTRNLLVVNGRFKPAKSASGQDVAGVWNSAMLWKLTESEPIPDASVDTVTNPQ